MGRFHFESLTHLHVAVRSGWGPRNSTGLGVLGGTPTWLAVETGCQLEAWLGWSIETCLCHMTSASFSMLTEF